MDAAASSSTFLAPALDLRARDDHEAGPRPGAAGGFAVCSGSVLVASVAGGRLAKPRTDALGVASSSARARARQPSCARGRRPGRDRRQPADGLLERWEARFGARPELGRGVARAQAGAALLLRVPEGDTLHRAAARARGRSSASGSRSRRRHPRARASRVAEQLDGRRLESVEAVGKNLVLRFEGGVVLRSHLRMSGRWARRRPAARPRSGRPWLVLRGDAVEGVLCGRPGARAAHAGRSPASARTSSPRRPTSSGMLARLRARRGRALARREAPGPDARRRDREHVDGRDALGARLSPWRAARRGARARAPRALETAAALMRAAVERRREPRAKRARPRRAPCPRCGDRSIRSRARATRTATAYWCPRCAARRASPLTSVRAARPRRANGRAARRTSGVSRGRRLPRSRSRRLRERVMRAIPPPPAAP